MEKMEKIVKEYITVEDGRIYYETAGQGDALLLVHAGFVDSRMWDAQFAFFAQHNQVIRFDLRGFGRSDAVQKPIIRREELYSIMKHLGIEQAVLVGCSMGGASCIDVAVEHPEMVRGLVLVSAVPSGFEMQGEPPPHMMEMFSALQQNDVERASELQIRLWVDGMFREPGQVNPLVRQHAAEMNRIPVANQTFLKADLQPFQPLDPPAVMRLKQIHAPALIIAGALDHPEILRAADFMEKELPAARKRILPGCAHVPNMEKPDEFNQVVDAFLQEVIGKK